MDKHDICFLSAAELSRLIQSKELSPVEVIESLLARIETLEPRLNSFITLLADRALNDAREAERDIQSGQRRGPLHGIPLGLKDLYSVKGIRNTSGTKLFHDHVPDYDSTVAARLKAAGAILMGKLNLHQLAYGPTGENPDYGDMHNPWNPELIAGGSSGGSASAAASGQCTLTMGSDTGGSIRIPSALCGLAGLKPTYGRLSRFGLTVLSWCLDHAGPMTRCVEDCALVMNAVAGYDRNDPASSRLPITDFTAKLPGDIRGVRVGVPREYFEVPLDPQVKHAVLEAIDLLGEMGAQVTEVSWPLYHQAAPISGTILMAEAAAYHSQLVREHAPELHSKVRLRLETGFFISAADYIQAQRARRAFNDQSRALFNQTDILAGPTVPITAFKIGDTQVKVEEDTVNAIAALTQYSRPFNLNGFPAITVPCGFSDDDLPIGLQLAGRPYEEDLVLAVAHAYEKATAWHRRTPVLGKQV